MQNNAFQPMGQIVVVDTSAVYPVPTYNNQSATSYRVRNTSTSAAYFAWAPPTSHSPFVPPSIAAPTAPAAGTPVSGVIGMVASSVEVFVLPQNCYFRASSGATFEVLPGEGI